MALSINFPFSDAENYNFDIGKVEIDASSGVAKLTFSELQPNYTCYADYSSSINLTRATGSLIGTPGGGASVSSGVLDLAHNDIRYVNYSGLGNADSQQSGCIRLTYIPNYNGAPASIQSIIGVYRGLSDVTNIIFLDHETSGDIHLYAGDEDGNLVINATLGFFSAVQGQRYEVELNYDFTNGATRVFIDGTQIGGTVTDTFIRSSEISILEMGNTILSSNFQIDNLSVSNVVRHTANYTPGEIVLGYATDNPTIQPKTTINVKEISSFIETSTVSGDDAIKWIISNDGVWYYWTGSEWAESDESYAQSSIASDIHTNISGLISDTSTVGFKGFLHSETGLTTPELENLKVQYTCACASQDTIQTTLVYGYIAGVMGEVSEQSIEVELSKPSSLYGNTSLIYNIKQTVTADDDGYFYIYLVPTSLMTESTYYIFTINDKKYYRYVPNQETVAFNSLEGAV